MSFEWPRLLWLLALLPLCVLGHVWFLRRQQAIARTWPGLVGPLAPATTGPLRRLNAHLPALLLLVALGCGLFALSRPQAPIVLPSQQQTVMLALDVSLSMRARDVEPDRFTAARGAARAFIQDMPDDVRAGIVAFAGTATLAQRPTTRREDLLAAIDRLEMQRGTATGNALVVALATLFPDHGLDLEAMQYGGARPGAERAPAAKPFKAVEPGSHPSAAIILLSDGRRTTGVDPIAAARLAAERGVRVYTVGIGTVQGGEVDFGGMSMYMRLDEEALKSIAGMTAGEYRYAATADDLRKVYQGLSSRLVLERRHTELSFAFAALAALLASASAGLSLWRRGRLF
jgi:Ca-activated chloride channel family protein